MILIVHYNTPELTEALVRSINKWDPGFWEITVFDNSDRRRFPDGVADNVRIIDNTEGQIIDFRAFLRQYPTMFGEEFNDWASAKHTYTIDRCFDLLPDGFLLMDSDILLKRSPREFVDRSVAWSGTRRIYQTPKGDRQRLWPFLCWINVPVAR